VRRATIIGAVLMALATIIAVGLLVFVAVSPGTTHTTTAHGLVLTTTAGNSETTVSPAP
jgi:hypothetical protein